MTDKIKIKLRFKPKRILPKGYTFIYDHETGDGYIWSSKTNTDLAVSIKTIKRRKNSKKYYTKSTKIEVNGKTNHYSIHRLIALHFIPNPNNLPQVDHINGDSLDNRLENLRWVTCSENNHNRKNAKGYYWDKSRNKWFSYININGKRINLGRRDTEEEARKLYEEASKNYFPDIKQELND